MFDNVLVCMSMFDTCVSVCVCLCFIHVLVCVTGQLLPTVVEHQALGILPTLLEMLHMCRCVCPCLTHVLVCVSVFYTCVSVCDRSVVAHSGRTPGTGNPAHIAGDVTHVLVRGSVIGKCITVCPCLICVLMCVTGQLLPTVVEHQALGILHTLLEMFSYRLHHTQIHYRVQLLSHLYTLASIQQANQNQLHLWSVH